MKKIFLTFAILSFALMPFQNLISGDLKEEIRNKLLYNSSQGREFWIAFPPNDVVELARGHIIEIYVTSRVNTTVTLEAPGTGDIFKKNVKAFEITTFTSEENTTRLSWEIRKGETVVHKGIKLTSPDPISVYAMNGKRYSSDGYLAIPVANFGNKHLHNSYYDYFLSGRGHELGAGFVIVASENNTKITMKLRGIGKGMAETYQGGHDIGDVLRTTLDEGETYMVRGDGTTRGMYDLSGSSIESNKPVGVFSFHMRTDIPSWDVRPGRDHIIEMVPPVSTWGKKAVSVEFKRETDKGDFFRIMCAEPNTKIEAAWYDKDTKELIKRIGPLTLKNEGDFYQYWHGFGQPGDEHKGVRGTSIWKADKPIQVYQYTYSHHFDNTMLFDPLMILVMPREQFVQETVFQTPSHKKYVNNYFNIIAFHDPEDKEMKDLKSIEIDGKPIHSINSQFLLNKIPTTNLYWIKIRVDPGSHHVTSNTEFSGYIYGFQKVDSYGWPACTAFNDLEQVDTLAPEIFVEGECGDYRIETTELRNGAQDDNPRQVDMGVEDISLLEGSFNYDLKVDPDFTPWPATYETWFELTVINDFEPARAIYAVTDRAFNVTIDTVTYEPDSLKLTPNELIFGNVRVNTTKEMDAKLENISTKEILIESIKLAEGSVFEILQGETNSEITMIPGEIRDIRVRYSPDMEMTNEDPFDIDTILVVTECLNYKFIVKGSGVLPHISVDDWDAGRVSVGTKLCRSTMDQGLKITNDGTDTLKVYNLQNVSAPFSISDPTIPEFTFSVPPKSHVFFRDICFEPQDTSDYEINVTFKNNAGGTEDDSVSTWIGKGMAPGPQITHKNWGERRVQTVHDSVIVMVNNGNTPFTINSFELEDPADPNFELIPGGIDPQPPVDLYKEGTTGEQTKITIEVRYKPQTEENHENAVIPVFQAETMNKLGIKGNLNGIGILPKIELTDYEFTPAIKKNTTHPDIGAVRIKSSSETADLKIKSIKWVNPGQQEFEFLRTPPSDTIITRKEYLDLDIKFHPTVSQKDITEQIEVISDAAPGDDPVHKSYAHVVGHSFDTGLDIGKIEFGTHLTCDPPEDTFPIVNNSSETRLKITKLEFAGGSISNFDTLYVPEIIQPGNEDVVRVKFIPDDPVNYRLDMTVHYDFIDEDDKVIESGTKSTYCTGTGEIVNTTLTTPAITNMTPGLLTTGEFEFYVTIDCDDFDKANIETFEIIIKYPSKEMVWTGKANDELEPGSALDDGWTIRAEELNEFDAGYSKLVLNGQGGTAISKSGKITSIVFRVILGDAQKFTPEFDLISFGARDECVTSETSNGEINVATCVRDLRSVIANAQPYTLHEPEPNPVNSDIFNLSYGIGLESHTKIELWNSFGERVRTLVEEDTEPGFYEKLISIEDLPSGVYYIRLLSGHYLEVKKMVIHR